MNNLKLSRLSVKTERGEKKKAVASEQQLFDDYMTAFAGCRPRYPCKYLKRSAKMSPCRRLQCSVTLWNAMIDS